MSTSILASRRYSLVQDFWKLWDPGNSRSSGGYGSEGCQAAREGALIPGDGVGAGGPLLWIFAVVIDRDTYTPPN